MQRCITVSYGRVSGKAKLYRYWEPAIYIASTRKRDGKLVWKLDYACGNARRSERLAKMDALEIAERMRIPFVEGVRQGREVEG
jgi:hypothetical protein